MLLCKIRCLLYAPIKLVLLCVFNIILDIQLRKRKCDTGGELHETYEIYLRLLNIQMNNINITEPKEHTYYA